MEIPQEQFNELKTKADKWDALGAKIEKCYAEPGDEDYDESRDELGLISVGEVAAAAFGWL